MNIKSILNSNCYNCKNKPCFNGCPLKNDIPNFILEYNNNNFENAKNILLQTSIMSSICGRICPHQSQCEGSCIQSKNNTPVNIGNIEAILGDYILDNFPKIISKPSDKKIAIIGSGPSGLTCAFYLKMFGYDVTIFEKNNYLGGLLQHGIPDFRLDKDIVKKLINNIINLGIDVRYNSKLGTNIILSNICKEYDAVFIAIGANCGNIPSIIGYDLTNVFSANELLEYNHHPDYTNKTVSIVGGGNVALDIARTVIRKKAKSVRILYRRALEQMPAEKKELKLALDEGIEIMYLTNIINNSLDKITCIKTYVDSETKLAKNLENTNFTLDNDILIFATGSKSDKKVLDNCNFILNEKNYIKVNQDYQTSIEKVFAGGDLIGTKPTVAWASYTGREAAKNIHKFLLKN